MKNQADSIASISTDQLAHVTGGNLVTTAGKYIQKAYKWWTGAKKAGTPEQIYGKGKEIVKDVGIAGGAIYGGKKVADHLSDK